MSANLSLSPSLTGSLRKAWRWWTLELLDCLPGWSSGSDNSARKTLVVSLDPSGPRLVSEKARLPGTSNAQPAAGTVVDVWDTIADLGKRRRAAPVWIRLPHTSCLVRRIEFPEAARRDAGRLLDLNLERTTPFRQKDIYTAHYVDEARSTRQTLHVCQLVVRREEVDRAISNLRSTGASLAGVDCWNEDASSALPVNFLPRAESIADANRSAHVKRLLLTLALILAVSAAGIAIHRHESALADITQHTSAARERAASARKARDDAKSAVYEIEAVRKLKASNTSTVAILDRLTRLLPDTVWVTDFRLDGGTIDVSGEADSAAGLILLLENSDLFTQAAFTAPVTRDESGGKESFSLRVHVKGRIPDQEPAP